MNTTTVCDGIRDGSATLTDGTAYTGSALGDGPGALACVTRVVDGSRVKSVAGFTDTTLTLDPWGIG